MCARILRSSQFMAITASETPSTIATIYTVAHNWLPASPGVTR